MAKDKKTQKKPKPETEGMQSERTVGLTVAYDGGTVKVTAKADDDTWKHPILRPQLEKLLGTLTALMAQAGSPKPGEIGQMVFDITVGDPPFMKSCACLGLREGPVVDTHALPPTPEPDAKPKVDNEPKTSTLLKTKPKA